ncbi:hypothetical protein PHSY_003804 [Pseudozyma hubeiensis SY62]|uniref:Uncharacterized protein n=1 Tax=Pseudozyma hubeiensis (strain SY62) TaxID=1305764 RepID=R9P4J0_PSEHS|nr:hypothetical protein PHSY_003804 [Pseudozyma hubeiensis SY62]GAC96224.1 hypothetical protein PHSY_003804 [Pseudozyma hubeiensis SY62]
MQSAIEIVEHRDVMTFRLGDPILGLTLTGLLLVEAVLWTRQLRYQMISSLACRNAGWIDEDKTQHRERFECGQA